MGRFPRTLGPQAAVIAAIGLWIVVMVAVSVSVSAATRQNHNLDRHWRNARVHTLHDPVRWKYHLVGAYELNGAYPARHQWN
jgi:alkylation response protein AidB-like acyl-CoA dehydrogenase